MLRLSSDKSITQGLNRNSIGKYFPDYAPRQADLWYIVYTYVLEQYIRLAKNTVFIVAWHHHMTSQLSAAAHSCGNYMISWRSWVHYLRALLIGKELNYLTAHLVHIHFEILCRRLAYIPNFSSFTFIIWQLLILRTHIKCPLWQQHCHWIFIARVLVYDLI